MSLVSEILIKGDRFQKQALTDLLAVPGIPEPIVALGIICLTSETNDLRNYALAAIEQYEKFMQLTGSEATLVASASHLRIQSRLVQLEITGDKKKRQQEYGW